ncbi:MAG: hypothetical protein FJ025_05485 [Chloroflexi bacterium]|nr:hypothetical protein [Chloroflexota bacterium]
MNNPRLQLKNVGQIEDADIEFGDLTVLVGPQATGKSIFLQFLRLQLDTGYVIDEMGTHGLVWSPGSQHSTSLASQVPPNELGNKSLETLE